MNAVVLFAGIVAVATAGGGGGTGVPVAGGQVLRLVQRSPLLLSQAESVRMDMTMKVSGNGASGSIRVRGDYDIRTGLARITAEGSGLSSVHVVESRHILYAPIASSQVLVYGGKHWVSLTIDRAQPQLTASGGVGYLQLFAGAPGQVMRVGHDTIAGVPTTHYRVTIDVASALSRMPAAMRTTSAAQLSAMGITTLPADVWLDEQGAARQLRVKLSIRGSTAEIRCRLSPSDTAVSIDVPAPADVYPVSTSQEFAAIARGTN
jgi:hypothetical protein